jgi:hypothetical protein
MPKKYQTFDLKIVFRSKKINQAIGKLWSVFFDRVSKLDYPVDRAIWICNRFPAWVGVKPGSEQDAEYEEPEFVLSAFVGELDDIQDEMRTTTNSESEYFRRMDPIYAEYYQWLRKAIKDTFQTSNIQKRRKSVGSARFGVYTTQIDDLHTSELEEMDWIAGSKLSN